MSNEPTSIDNGFAAALARKDIKFSGSMLTANTDSQNYGRKPPDLVNFYKLHTDGAERGKSVVVLNADGSIDDSFVWDTNTSLQSIAVQSTNKIVLFGSNYNGTEFRETARFNTDGSVDSSFTRSNITLANNGRTLGCIAVESNDDILIGGEFTAIQQFADQPSTNFATVSNIARLNGSTGLYTNSLSTTITGGAVDCILPLSSGKILVGGRFTTVNGSSKPYIVLLNSNGTTDTSFNLNLNERVSAMAIQPSDSKIVIVGGFTQVNSQGKNYIVRLNSDLTIDTDFNIGGSAFGTLTAQSISISRAPSSVSIQSNGNILVTMGEEVFAYAGGGSSGVSYSLVQLNSAGTRVSAFPQLPTVSISGEGREWDGCSGYASIELSNGKILCGGTFSSFGGHPSRALVRLNSDGYPDFDYISLNFARLDNAQVTNLIRMPNGKIAVSMTYPGDGWASVPQFALTAGLAGSSAATTPNDGLSWRRVAALPIPVRNAPGNLSFTATLEDIGHLVVIGGVTQQISLYGFGAPVGSVIYFQLSVFGDCRFSSDFDLLKSSLGYRFRTFNSIVGAIKDTSNSWILFGDLMW